jgi:hypothetical protein
MLTTWFLASNKLVAKRFQLGVEREVKDPITKVMIRIAGPVWQPLTDLPYFQIDGIELPAVALLFEVDALEEVDRTRIVGVTASVAPSLGLPALYRVRPEAVAVFQKGLKNKAQRARSWGERARAKGLQLGVDVGASPSFLERSGAWRSEVLPDTESELVEAFATLLEDADPGCAIVGLAEEA